MATLDQHRTCIEAKTDGRVRPWWRWHCQSCQWTGPWRCHVEFAHDDGDAHVCPPAPDLGAAMRRYLGREPQR